MPDSLQNRSNRTLTHFTSLWLIILLLGSSFSCKKETPIPEEVLIYGTRLKESITYRDGELWSKSTYTYTDGLRTQRKSLSYEDGNLADSSRSITIRQGNWQRTSSQKFIGSEWEDQSRLEIFALDNLSREVKWFSMTNGEPVLFSFKKFQYAGGDCVEEEHFGYNNGGQNQHYKTEIIRESSDYTYGVERYEAPLDGEWYELETDTAFYSNGLKTRTALWRAPTTINDWMLRVEHFYTYENENFVEHTRRQHYDDGSYGDVTTSYTYDSDGLRSGSSQISPATGALFTTEYIYEEGNISQSNWSSNPRNSIFGS